MYRIALRLSLIYRDLKSSTKIKSTCWFWMLGKLYQSQEQDLRLNRALERCQDINTGIVQVETNLILTEIDRNS